MRRHIPVRDSDGAFLGVLLDAVDGA